MFAPKGITPQQLAYWEGVLRKSTEAAEWKEELEKNIWSDVFTGSAQFSKDLEQDYSAMKAVLVDLGLAK
jgi:putative tricarboxylic transport membrane protein